MTLLLVGIVTVIVVILVAAFLTFRGGQDDDRDESGGRWTVRDRVRSAGRDGHWRSPAQEMRAPRRLGRSEASQRPSEQRSYDDLPQAYAERRAGRSLRDQNGDRGHPARPAGRYAGAPDAADYPASRARGTHTAGSASRRAGLRRQPDSYDTASYDAGPGEQLYDTGPSPVMDDEPSLPGEHEFALDHEDDSALTDSDVFPRIRTDIPARSSKPSAPAKGRNRQSRSKRGDDDDWPSTEWDKLSDEQYWAELSADKPLATTARAAQPTSAQKAPAPPSPAQPKPAQPKPAQPKPAQPKPAQPKPAQPKPAQARPVAAKPAHPAPVPDRESVAPRRRERHPEPAEALPVSSRPRTAATPVAPAAAAQPPLPRESGEPSLAMLTSLANAPTARRAEPIPAPRDDDPLTSPSFSRQATPAQDSRSYRSTGRDRQRGTTNDYPAGGYPSVGYANGGYGNSGGAHGYRANDSEHTSPQAAYPAAWPSEHRPAPQPAPPRAPAGNPYGSYVDSAPGARTGSHAAAYPDDRARANGGYGSYPPAAATGYPEPPFRPPAGPDPAVGLPARDSGWHSAPPPSAPDFPTDPASQYLYTGGSGYPDAAGYDAGLPAEASYQDGYAEPAGYPERAYNSAGYADGYSTDPYGPDGYGGYRPRQA